MAYHTLHRYLHRRMFYYEKYRDEIAQMDLSRMTKFTRGLMYCIIKCYRREFMFEEFVNLHDMIDAKPFPERLLMDCNPLPEQSIYKEMNVAY